MGQAKQRGAFEERRAAALERREEELRIEEEKRAAEEKAALEWWNGLTEAERYVHLERVQRKRQKRVRSRSFLAAMVVGALMSF
jgi:hypothetical protein